MFYRKKVKLAAIVFVALLTGACAQGARDVQMSVAPDAKTTPIKGSPLRFSVTVRSTKGGEKTNPMLVSQVSTGAFRKALVSSLQANGLLASKIGRYQLDAWLLGLKQPVIGISMTVTATVRYRLTNSAGAKVFEKIVVTPYTASFSQSALGVERLRIANEGAIRANIKRFMVQLIAQFQGAAGTGS